jgi:hypothetical protein
MDNTPPVYDQCSPISEQQANSALHIADINRFKVCVEHQDIFAHGQPFP